jgi:hypothetical protein
MGNCLMAFAVINLPAAKLAVPRVKAHKRLRKKVDIRRKVIG